MSYGIICHQQKCNEYGAFRYTWPGQNEAAVCAMCARRLENVAFAIGLPLQLIPLSAEDHAKLGFLVKPNPATAPS